VKQKRLMGGKPEKQNRPAQQDSGMSNLGLGLMSPMGPIGLMSKMPVMKNGPAQRDYEISILKVESETSSAQQDSGMSNLGLGLMSPMGPIGLIGKKPVMKNGPAQRDSGNSSLGVSRTGLTSPTGLAGGLVEPQCTPAQQDSGMSILKAESETSPAQRYSGNSNLGLGVLGILGILRSLGILGGKTKNENTPAQRDSVIYFWAIRLLSPSCPSCPLDFKNRPAQPDSGMSNFGWMGRWGDESMGQQNLPDKLSGFHKRFF